MPYLITLKDFLTMNRQILIAAMLLTGIAASAQNGPKDWAQFGRYADANKNVSISPKAVFMGDSITDGWDDNDADFFHENNFLCRGISGQTTSEMLERFRQDVISHHPKYVVILAGTNDLAQNNGYISIENIMSNLKSMCELAKVHKIKPVLCSLTPVTRYGWRPEIENPTSKVIELNEMIRAYAEKEHIKYVDYHSALKDDKGGFPEKYSGDSVHPNGTCYKIMEKIILENL